MASDGPNDHCRTEVIGGAAPRHLVSTEEEPVKSLSSKSPSHRRLSAFVDWIRTPDDREERIKSQADEVRRRLRGKAESDKLIIRSMPFSGSYEKGTGLRRHMQGEAEIEGQDVDIAIVIDPRSVPAGADRERLIERFLSYFRASYPDTQASATRSSVRVAFVGSKVNFDLVPMLAVEGTDREQLLFRSNGERRRTSIQNHIEFVRRRNKRSNELPGRVKFNECVRLVKWWRHYCEGSAQQIEEVPSILVDLLCAKAFDQHGVAATYTETLAQWFSTMADLALRRRLVAFDDFGSVPDRTADDRQWAVLDPVNPDNNVLPLAWNNLHIGELADWLSNARDQWAEVESLERVDEVDKSRRVLIELFGNPFKHHGEL
ncbi:CBASS oligonucleotide cyclase [Nannocystis sp. RBIL2]|uniref:CBASS oligonucleotide cyclase n=1 Tax=Nannocystis sp. RBIL2 TaxID=2996788 RepID=UPI00226D44E6|nr:CBASS oligonucleotide cyclase [Nannocystis sp. RBIL2]